MTNGDILFSKGLHHYISVVGEEIKTEGLANGIQHVKISEGYISIEGSELSLLKSFSFRPYGRKFLLK